MTEELTSIMLTASYRNQACSWKMMESVCRLTDLTDEWFSLENVKTEKKSSS